MGSGSTKRRILVERIRSHEILRQTLGCCLVAAGYYIGTLVGLALTPKEHPISTLWPPNAILLGALLLAPKRRWPLLLLAVFPVHLALQLTSGIPFLTSLGWFATNTCEAVLGAFCIRLVVKRGSLFDSFSGVLAFVLFGVLVAPIATSFLDAAVVVSTGWGTDYWMLWRMRSFSNMLATLTLVPPIVVLANARFGPWRDDTRNRLLEASLLGIALVAAVQLVFSRVGTSPNSIPALMYLLLPILLWAAVRFGCGGVSTALLVTALLSIWNVIHGRGPFAFAPTANAIFSLQVLLCVINVPLLSLSAVLQERENVGDALRRNEDFLKLVSEIAADFVNVPWQQIDREVQRGLRRVRHLVGVDRASVFAFDERDGFSLLYSVGEGVPRAKSLPRQLFTDEVRWSRARLQRGETLMIGEIASVPEAAGDQSTFAERSLNAIALVPLGRRGSLSGALSLVAAQKVWPVDLAPRLHVLGEIFYDALQRKRAMQALWESEQRFRITADSAPMLVWMSGIDNMRIYSNRAWLNFTGLDEEQALGEGWMQSVHPEDIEICRSTHRSAVDNRHHLRMEYRLRRHDGVFRWVLSIGVPRFDSGGVFLGLIGSAVDISDRKLAEEAVMSFGGRLISAQENERQRIARELHDDVGQRLALLTIGLDEMRNDLKGQLQDEASKLWEQATRIGDLVHQISHNLHSSAVDWLSLPNALQALSRDFPRSQSIEIRFQHRNVPETLSPEVKLCFYRITQEALQNISKHSQARQVAIILNCADSRLTLRIKDDGIGFALERQPILGLGLISMRERLRSIGGVLTVLSAPAHGTTIVASAPLNSERLESDNTENQQTSAERDAA